MEQDYHYYDDTEMFDGLENQDLLQTMPNNKDKNYFLALIGTALMMLLTASSLIIAWILWNRNRHSYLLWFAIWSSITFLISIFCFLHFFNKHKNRFDSFAEEKPLMDFIMICLLLILFVVFLTSGVFLLMYKPFHFYIMREQLHDDKQWKKHWGNDFKSEWAEDKNLLLTLSILSFLIAFATLLPMLNQYQTIQSPFIVNMVLFFCGLLIAGIFAFVAIREYLLIRLMEDELGGSRPLRNSTFKFLFILMIIIIIVAVINYCVAFIKNRHLHILFFLALLILGIIGIIALSLFLRNFKELTTQKDFYDTGRYTLQRMPENSVKQCNQKYTQTPCGQSDGAVQWENGSTISYLNQECYTQVQRWYYFKYFRFAHFAMISLIFLLGAGVGNLLHAEAEEHEKDTSNYLLIICMALLILFGIGFGIYLIFLGRKTGVSKYDNFQQQLQEQFEPVQFNKELTDKIGTECGEWEDMDLWTINGEKTDYYRVAILGQNLKFENLDTTFNPQVRGVFFNDRNLAQNSFVLYHGLLQNIQQKLDKLQICIRDYQGNANIYIHVEKVKQSDLNDNGLKQNESLNNQSTNNDPNVNFNANWNYSGKLTCNNLCQEKFDFNSNTQQIDLFGQIKVQDKNGVLQNYDQNQFGKLTANLIFKDDNTKSVDIDGTGNLNTKIIAFQGIKQNLDLQIIHPKGYFLKSQKTLTIPQRQNLITSYQIGDQILLTKDGNSCYKNPNVANCINNASLQQGEILLENDLSSFAHNIKAVLRQTHSINGKKLKEQIIDENQENLGKFDFGQYSVIVESDNYFKITQEINLQSSKQLIQLNLIEIPDEGTERFYVKIPQAQNNIQMNLEIQNKQGNTCTVAPGNVYCAYARYQNHFNTKNEEIEIIDVEKYVKANYMLYISPEKQFSQTCPVQQYREKHIYHRTSKHFLFDQVKKFDLSDLSLIFFEGSRRTSNQEIQFDKLSAEIFVLPAIQFVQKYASRYQFANASENVNKIFEFKQKGNSNNNNNENKNKGFGFLDFINSEKQQQNEKQKNQKKTPSSLIKNQKCLLLYQNLKNCGLEIDYDIDNFNEQKFCNQLKKKYGKVFYTFEYDVQLCNMLEDVQQNKFDITDYYPDQQQQWNQSNFDMDQNNQLNDQEQIESLFSNQQCYKNYMVLKNCNVDIQINQDDFNEQEFCQNVQNKYQGVIEKYKGDNFYCDILQDVSKDQFDIKKYYPDEDNKNQNQNNNNQSNNGGQNIAIPDISDKPQNIDKEKPDNQKDSENSQQNNNNQENPKNQQQNNNNNNSLNQDNKNNDFYCMKCQEKLKQIAINLNIDNKLQDQNQHNQICTQVKQELIKLIKSDQFNELTIQQVEQENCSTIINAILFLYGRDQKEPLDCNQKRLELLQKLEKGEIDQSYLEIIENINCDKIDQLKTVLKDKRYNNSCLPLMQKIKNYSNIDNQITEIKFENNNCEELRSIALTLMQNRAIVLDIEDLRNQDCEKLRENVLQQLLVKQEREEEIYQQKCAQNQKLYSSQDFIKINSLLKKKECKTLRYFLTQKIKNDELYMTIQDLKLLTCQELYKILEKERIKNQKKRCINLSKNLDFEKVDEELKQEILKQKNSQIQECQNLYKQYSAQQDNYLKLQQSMNQCYGLKQKLIKIMTNLEKLPRGDMLQNISDKDCQNFKHQLLILLREDHAQITFEEIEQKSCQELLNMLQKKYQIIAVKNKKQFLETQKKECSQILENFDFSHLNEQQKQYIEETVSKRDIYSCQKLWKLYSSKKQSLLRTQQLLNQCHPLKVKLQKIQLELLMLNQPQFETGEKNCRELKNLLINHVKNDEFEMTIDQIEKMDCKDLQKLLREKYQKKMEAFKKQQDEQEIKQCQMINQNLDYSSLSQYERDAIENELKDKKQQICLTTLKNFQKQKIKYKEIKSQMTQCYKLKDKIDQMTQESFQVYLASTNPEFKNQKCPELKQNLIQLIKNDELDYDIKQIEQSSCEDLNKLYQMILEKELQKLQSSLNQQEIEICTKLQQDQQNNQLSEQQQQIMQDNVQIMFQQNCQNVLQKQNQIQQIQTQYQQQIKQCSNAQCKMNLMIQYIDLVQKQKQQKNQDCFNLKQKLNWINLSKFKVHEIVDNEICKELKIALAEIQDRNPNQFVGFDPFTADCQEVYEKLEKYKQHHQNDRRLSQDKCQNMRKKLLFLSKYGEQINLPLPKEYKDIMQKNCFELRHQILKDFLNNQIPLITEKDFKSDHCYKLRNKVIFLQELNEFSDLENLDAQNLNCEDLIDKLLDIQENQYPQSQLSKYIQIQTCLNAEQYANYVQEDQEKENELIQANRIPEICQKLRQKLNLNTNNDQKRLLKYFVKPYHYQDTQIQNNCKLSIRNLSQFIDSDFNNSHCLNQYKKNYANHKLTTESKCLAISELHIRNLTFNKKNKPKRLLQIINNIQNYIKQNQHLQSNSNYHLQSIVNKLQSLKNNRLLRQYTERILTKFSQNLEKLKKSHLSQAINNHKININKDDFLINFTENDYCLHGQEKAFDLWDALEEKLQLMKELTPEELEELAQAKKEIDIKYQQEQQQLLSKQKQFEEDLKKQKQEELKSKIQKEKEIQEKLSKMKQKLNTADNNKLSEQERQKILNEQEKQRKELEKQKALLEKQQSENEKKRQEELERKKKELQKQLEESKKQKEKEDELTLEELARRKREELNRRQRNKNTIQKTINEIEEFEDVDNQQDKKEIEIQKTLQEADKQKQEFEKQQQETQKQLSQKEQEQKLKEEQEQKQKEEQEQKLKEEQKQKEEQKIIEEQEKQKQEELNQQEQENQELIVEVRRLQKRKLQQANNYVLLKCFTGFGKQSEIIVEKPYTNKPKMIECSNLLDKTDYSLERLISG